MILSNVKERNRFFRFAVVGAAGAVIDFGVFNLLTNFIGFFKTNAVWATVISFILAVFSNYYWNRVWTYPDSRSKPVSRQVLQFFLVSVIGLAIRTPMFAGLEKILIRFFNSWWHWNIASPIFLAHNLALAIVILVVMIWNFIANRYWTYNDVSA
jgi:putative flippase GtrA